MATSKTKTPRIKSVQSTQSKAPQKSSVKVIDDPILKAMSKMDSWSNAMTGIGGVRDKTMGMGICPAVPLNEAQLEALYMTDDLASTIVDSIPEDSMSKNIMIKGEGSEHLTSVFDRLNFLDTFIEAWKWGRLHGGGAIFMGIQDVDQSSQLNPRTHGKLLYTLVLDRWEMQVASYYTDPTLPKYGQPRTYRVTPRSSNGSVSNTMLGVEVHESRFIMFGGASTPKRFKAANNGWDASVLQRSYDVLRDYAGIWRSASYAVSDMSQGVFKIKGLVDMISEGHKDQLLDRMELVDMARSVARSVVVDADTEDFSVVGSANLGAIPTILDQANSRVAAAARMPVTRLMGTSPGGLNATGDSDLSNWYGVIDIAREQIARPRLLKLLHVIARSYGITTEGLDVEFPALWSLSDLEEADLNNKNASTDQLYLSMGVITKEEIREKLSASAIYDIEPTIPSQVPSTPESSTAVQTEQSNETIVSEDQTLTPST